METDELPVLDSNVDFREVPPLHQKRTIAFVNHFILKTVSFLNTFAASCESRLMELETKLEKVNASLLILESQLTSIPSLDPVLKQLPEVNIPLLDDDDNNPLLDVDENDHVVDVDEVGPPKACEDSRYARFFKMLQFGVPLLAVKQKMETEGFDPFILDTPNDVIN